MAPAAPPARKRVRKRKRRQASSSEDSSSSSSSDSEPGSVQRKTAPAAAAVAARAKEATPSSSSSSSSDSSSESESETEAAPVKPAASRKQPSRSPSPVSAEIPPFQADNEQLKDRFRQFWMGSVADAFKDDLEQIRKEPNLTTSRLAILIDSLGEGAKVFSTSSDVDEMQLVLEPST
ncbi:hypothetical protein AURDEDRAFT_145757 [Auricularia subglabra TFB-10046 SS5]|nr:hypothetical protein AURDEDRAFT_145757 [Auricularia subglabra TFB-10046 SS5]